MTKSIIEHIYEHPFALIVYNKEGNKWYSLRAMGEYDYWVESQDGEGTQVKPGDFYKHIDNLFREVF